MLKAWLIAALAVTGAAAMQQPPEPSGNYVVVGLRAASDVAVTVDAREDTRGAEWMGTTLGFDGLPMWYDGTACHDRDVMVDADPDPAVNDPNLSDLQVVPGPGDQRLNVSLTIDCGGAAQGSIKHLLMVDNRVLVERTPNGSGYVILEKPLEPSEALALEKGLAAAGYDPGPVDGTIDALTRSALAAYAEAHGAAYRFAAGVITANLLAALTDG